MITEIDNTMAVAAAMVFADVFGLGDSCRPLTTWPTDEGDDVLSAEYVGDLRGNLLLAVNHDVAARLHADPDRLASGFAKALEAITSSTGMSLELGEITTADLEGETIVEICDGVRRCALLGITPYSDSPGAPPQRRVKPSEDVLLDQRPPASVFSALGVMSEPTLLDNVDVVVTVELGRTMMPLQDLLSMQPGMLIRLDKLVNEPVDVMVNDRHLTVGHVMTIEDKFGVKIADPDSLNKR